MAPRTRSGSGAGGGGSSRSGSPRAIAAEWARWWVAAGVKDASATVVKPAAASARRSDGGSKRTRWRGGSRPIQWVP